MAAEIEKLVNSGWLAHIPQFTDGTIDQLIQQVDIRRRETAVYPPPEMLLRAFSLVPFDHVKVVILGQDPYHTPGMADGLAFSVPAGQRVPPSLRNIFKEIRNDIYDGEALDLSADLTRWAAQGVFLLNTTLSVEQGRPRSHRKLGWSAFTDAVIAALSNQRIHLVFMLWGNDARRKKGLIDTDRHLLLEAPHPSPLARGGFFGCRHFSQANAYLQQQAHTAPIRW